MAESTVNRSARTSGGMVRVEVLLFSVLREVVGREALAVSLSALSTGADLLDALQTEHPALAPHRPTIRLAINQEYVPETSVLADGDEVALITPVSGG